MGELYYCTTFHPTHIVHLSAWSPNAYFAMGNAATGTDDETGHDGGGWFAICRLLMGMEQILSCMAHIPDPSQLSHWVYMSSNHFHNAPPLTSSSSPSLWQEVLHGCSWWMDEIVAEYDHAKYGTYSVALRLPNGVYGPWSPFK